MFLTIPVFVPTSMSDLVFDAVGEVEQALNANIARPISDSTKVFIGSSSMKVVRTRPLVFFGDGLIVGTKKGRMLFAHIVISTVLRWCG
jgi:hypothetical protein